MRVLMVMVGDPFEIGFERDGCRSIQNGLAIPFVTPRREIFSAQRAFDAPSGVQDNMSVGFVSMLLPASVRCSKRGVRERLPRTIRLENIGAKTG
jgi:hypothetical protein